LIGLTALFLTLALLSIANESTAPFVEHNTLPPDHTECEDYAKFSRRLFMLETLIVVILILWLLGFGWGRRGRGRRSARWAGGNLIHLLLVVVLILLLIRFLQ